MVFILTAGSSVQSLAHSVELDVEYDECWPEKYDDGVYEMWYSLHEDGTCRHISDTDMSIKYYFSGNDAEWIKCVKRSFLYDITDAQALAIVNDIKTAYVESMKKWNNVYFYSYDSNGNKVKRKIINIVIVLVPEDEEAYLNGTLEFRTGEIM